MIEIISEDSSVISLNETARLCHVLTMLSLSFPSGSDADGNMIWTPSRHFIYHNVAVFLAVRHFNNRDNAVISDLSQRLDGCDIQLSLSMTDNRFSPIIASRHAQEAIYDITHSLETPRPTAIVGAVMSSVSVPISVLAGTNKILQVSPLSTSPVLDNKSISPYFGRTVPTNAGDARALVVFLKDLGVTHFGMLHVRDGKYLHCYETWPRKRSMANLLYS